VSHNQMYSALTLPSAAPSACQDMTCQHADIAKMDVILANASWAQLHNANVGLPCAWWNFAGHESTWADQEVGEGSETGSKARRRRHGGRKHRRPHQGGAEMLPHTTTVNVSSDHAAEGGSQGRENFEVAAGRETKTFAALGAEWEDEHPLSLVSSPDLCNRFITLLETDAFDRETFLECVLEHTLQLALGSRCSCRVVQQLLEVLGGSARDKLVAQLHPGTIKLYESPHGNYVLTKMIEVVPRPALNPIIDRMRMQGGRVVARHRFGCRIMERLLEHGDEAQMQELTEHCVEHAEELSRHQFGNFVIQSLLEHGSHRQRDAILLHMLPFMPLLSMHRTASHVVQKALNYSSEEGRHAIVNSLICAVDPPLIQIAANRYGAYVLEEVHQIFGEEGPGRRVKQSLEVALPHVGESEFLARVAVQFGLLQEEQVPQQA